MRWLAAAVLVGVGSLGFAQEPVVAKGTVSQVEAKVKAEPAMWMVKGVHGTLYLFGTVHVMRKDVLWETPKVKAAVAASKVLYLEVPGVDESAAAAAQPIIMQLGMDSEHPLSTKISKEDVALLDTALKSMGVTEQAVEPMQPWLVYLTLSVLPGLKAGYDPASGIDKVLETEMKAQGKPVKGFETVDQQVHFLADFPQAQQVALLHEELTDLPDGGKKIDEIVGNWETGNVERIGEIDNGELKAKHPELYAKLLVDRNIRFAKEIGDLLKDPATETVFVAIGAGHFAGADSVVKMLEKQGFTVTRVE